MADDTVPGNSPLSLSFSGSGFLSLYQIGAVKALLELAPEILKLAPKVYGASAGSLVATAVVFNVNLDYSGTTLQVLCPLTSANDKRALDLKHYITVVQGRLQSFVGPWAREYQWAPFSDWLPGRSTQSLSTSVRYTCTQFLKELGREVVPNILVGQGNLVQQIKDTSSLLPFEIGRYPAVPLAQNWQKPVGSRYTHLLFGEVWPEVFFMEELRPKSHTFDVETRPSEDELQNIISAAANEVRKTIFGPFLPNFNLPTILRKALLKFLPENAHEIASGRLNIALTRLSDGKTILVSDFKSKEEVIQALICGCFVPFYCGLVPPLFRGVRYIDGGFTCFQPLFDLESMITVSPFTGEIDICPRDCPVSHLCFQIFNTSFQLSVQNLCRVSYALFPPSSFILNTFYCQGYEDAILYLNANGK